MSSGLGYDDASTIVDNPVRQLCEGIVPLNARLESWMQEVIEAKCLEGLLDQYGSPVNVVDTQSMRRNVHSIQRVAKNYQIDFRPFFARKTNKCLSFVDEAKCLGIGVDVASEAELSQCLHRGFRGQDLICTAAIKSQSLLQLCLQHDVCVAVDNWDEIAVLVDAAHRKNTQARIAIRLGGFEHDGQKLKTRFGFDVKRDQDLLATLPSKAVNVAGIHFHLDGYDWRQRVTGIVESVRWAKQARSLGFDTTFIDMGGGFPIRYLDDPGQWQDFWREHTLALLNQREPITYGNHNLGRTFDGSSVGDDPNVYPYYQPLIREDWLANVLTATIPHSNAGVGDWTVADDIRESSLQLRCEPGRSLMDGCGMTVARVEFAKQNADDDWLFGLAMNRTQCRTTSDDFLVDPIVVHTGSNRGSNAESAGGDAGRFSSVGSNESNSVEGYLVGSYCMESELLTWRKLRFPHGLRRGDLVVFPNTAGYLMHFLESRSHQFPLANNLVYSSAAGSSFTLDDIDA